MSLGADIGGELGSDRIRLPSEIERPAAETIVEPQSVEEIAALVRRCETDQISLAPLGAARTLSQIRRTPVKLGVSLRRMARITAYEPEDMTAVVEAGLTLGDFNATLASRGQRLPVDPRNPKVTTLGSLIAAAHAGPLRLSEGTVRDLLIGIRYVGRGGRIVHAGGRVVKNVAGYDLMKMMTGAFGTLGIVTEATFKVRPIPENYTLAAARFENHDEAFAAASRLHDAIPLVHLEIAGPAVSASIGIGDGFAVLAGFAGIASELNHQREVIGRLLPSFESIEGAGANEIYSSVRDFSFDDNAVVARIAVLPNELGRCLRESSGDFIAHVGSGIAELSTSSEHEVIPRLRNLAHSARGQLRILSTPASLRSELEFFDRPDAGPLKLMQRLKSSFDPAGIFNPGCFVGGV